MIFWTITGSFASAVIYDKYQTKKMREKWCSMVAHIADETLDTKTLPRKVTIYLQAPPGDGLRSAREHFHTYIKPVLVAAAMDWDVVEGRKEGDVRHKTAEKIRKRRKRNGEGKPAEKEEDTTLTVEQLREKAGHVDYPGVAGDIVVGRNTWKEYIRGLHEGYLGPPDNPHNEPETEAKGETPNQTTYVPGTSSLGDAAVKSATNIVETQQSEKSPVSSLDSLVADAPSQNPRESATTNMDDSTQSETETKAAAEQTEAGKQIEAEEEKPKRRFPLPYIVPEDYESAPLSASTPDIIGPSVGVRLPHLLGFRNTPIRIYRFLNRRVLMDDIGRQVASAILESHRPYSTISSKDEDSASDAVVERPEQKTVLDFEEKDWYKTVHQPRKEHEESVWVEPIVLDERLASRMRKFDLNTEDEARAKRIESGVEQPAQKTDQP